VSGPPRFLDAGEAALVVEFGDVVDPTMHDRVLGLDAALLALRAPGVVETVPTYRSLMIHYDPLVVTREELVRLVALLPTTAPPRTESLWTIPCCYEGALGEELGEIAARLGLSPERVVSLHAGACYRVYMYGFAPGFCYLGGLPPELSLSRRPVPRPPHPPNVVLVAGGLCLIATISMPTGWWIIGTTPERMFSPQRAQPFLMEVGDSARFEPIDRPAYDALEKRAAAGEIVARRKLL
jgi:KipI family sensor histidine kinase inhibitor